MKSLFICLLLLTTVAFAQEKIIENPPFSVRSSEILEIRKIVLDNKRTEIEFTAYQQPGRWFRVATGSYIRANGKKYLADTAIGLSLDKETFTGPSGQMNFTLSFPPIDLNTERIDFIESDCEACFKIWGIELKSKFVLLRDSIPASVKNAPKTGGSGMLPVNNLKLGKTSIKGILLGYVPEMKFKLEAFLNNPLTREQEEYEFPIADDGSFKAEVPLVYSTQLLLRVNDLINENVLVAPGGEMEVYVDLPLRDRQQSKLRVDSCPAAKWVYFGGTYAGINNEYFDKQAQLWKLYLNADALTDTDEIDLATYRKNILERWKQKKEELAQQSYSPQLKQLVTLELNHALIGKLIHAPSNMEWAYRKKHNIGAREPIPDYKRFVLDSGYFRFLKEMDLNNPVNLYTFGFENVINGCSYLTLNSEVNSVFFNRMPDIAESLIKMTRMTPRELTYANYLAAQKYERWSPKSIAAAKQQISTYIDSLLKIDIVTGGARRDAERIRSSITDANTTFRELYTAFDRFTFSHMALLQKLNYMILIENTDTALNTPKFSVEFVNNFQEKYKPYTDVLFREEMDKSYTGLVAEMLDTDKGLLFDLMYVQKMASSLEEMEPVSSVKMDRIRSLNNPVFLAFITERNKQLLAKIEANKRKTGYRVYNTPKVENDALLAEILKPFQGKVIFIDFWNTWCSPCRSAMQTFEPVKQQYKDKNIAFVYLADESSPITAWENMIAGIPGEHYRLNGPQMQYLSKKFGIKGIPSYLILNQKAEQVYFKTGFSGNEVISGILDKELEKE
ncbi:TlpA family protein disulfide reductase [Filimonas effusa]|uniref:TlpA family protein disulfide reductase n=1 Tax=Filimonas effusa TaxID=2508721 RepID=A0A4Q1D7U7_9BACT|nr:TlpA disulfide reductase family protein [Filimonas effusa]RXK83787.1 TlpA family protein disulfide reductase [Filimonas effusa]